MPKFHLAQVNIASMKYPLDDSRMAGFVNRLDEINALAEQHPGFVWRLKDEGNDATSLRPFPDERIIVNMSVWKSVEDLKDYTYKTVHTEVMRQRRDWFYKHEKPPYVLWWIPVGHIPTVQEAKERLDDLHENGATVRAFDFRTVFLPKIS